MLVPALHNTFIPCQKPRGLYSQECFCIPCTSHACFGWLVTSAIWSNGDPEAKRIVSVSVVSTRVTWAKAELLCCFLTWRRLFNSLTQSFSYNIPKQLLNLNVVYMLGWFVMVMGTLLTAFRHPLFQEFAEWMWRSEASSLFPGFEQQITVCFACGRPVNLLGRTSRCCLFCGHVQEITSNRFSLALFRSSRSKVYLKCERNVNGYLTSKYPELLMQLNVKMDWRVLVSSSDKVLKPKVLYN